MCDVNDIWWCVCESTFKKLDALSRKRKKKEDFSRESDRLTLALLSKHASGPFL